MHNLTDKEKGDAVREMMEAMEVMRKERKRFRRKQILRRLIFIPLIFIVANGSFFVIFWAIGGFRFLKFLADINGFVLYAGVFLTGLLYFGFILLIGKPASKMIDRLRMSWLLDD